MKTVFQKNTKYSTRKLMFLALHGPPKTTGFTKNVCFGMITVGFSVSELHAPFHALKNACNIADDTTKKENAKMLSKKEGNITESSKFKGKEITWESSVVPSQTAP